MAEKYCRSEGNEHKVADVGKYNAGQKMMFWSIIGMIFVLPGDWRDYLASVFRAVFSIRVVRYSLLIHAAAGIIFNARDPHPYVSMAFWVKGSIKGMIEGKVSRRWAASSHAGIVKSEGRNERERKGIQ